MKNQSDHSIKPHMISYVHSSSSEMVELRKSSCEACPDTPTTKRWWIQYGDTQDHTACFPICQQPSDVTDCDNPDTITVGKNNYHNNTFAKQQCAHCGNRNYNGNFYYSYGLCDGGVTFTNIDFECISCTTTTARTEIPLGVATEDNCISCEGKRVMKTGSTDDKNLKAYCVKKCVSGEFQKTDGKCYTGSNDYGTIGSDEQSKTLCRESGRVAFLKQNNGVTDWYCSQTTVEGEHFIGITGQRVACTAGDTQIPDSQDARNLCTKCTNRFVETVDDKIVCRQ